MDVIAILTNQADFQLERNYWKVLKSRLLKEGNESVTNCNRLKLVAENGKIRELFILLLDFEYTLNHSMRMKRTNLVLDENILEQTLRLSQKKTYSEAVTIAMKEFIRVNEFSKIFEFQGTGIWSGDLSEMRKDVKVVKSKNKKKSK